MPRLISQQVLADGRHDGVYDRILGVGLAILAVDGVYMKAANPGNVERDLDRSVGS